MDFSTIWKQLDEIYAQELNNSGENEYYHFYQDLSDLLNSLYTKSIYTTKNDSKENKKQYDYNSKDGSAYACFTTTIDGKKYMIGKFDRPFGIGMSKETLTSLCATRNYVLDTNGYNAFKVKGDYIQSARTPQLLAQQKDHGSNPFNIFAIGELEPGLYFISGGQGAHAMWAGQTFEDEKLYTTLKKWFTNNFNDGAEYQKRIFYHFIDGNIGDTVKSCEGKPIVVSGNLNINYKPREDSIGSDSGETRYTASMAFLPSGKYSKSFKEIIGYGPIDVSDNAGTNLLSMTYVNPNVKGGYKGPLLFGADITDANNKKFSNKENDFRDGSKTTSDYGISQQKHFFADKATFDKLCAIYNEHEFRVYIDSGNDMHFNPTDIELLVLPEHFCISQEVKETLDIRAIVDRLSSGEVYPSSSGAIINRLIKQGIITKQANKKTAPSRYICEIAVLLISLLQGEYRNVGVELIKDHISKANANINQAYLKGRDARDKILSVKDIKTNDKARKVISVWPDLARAESISAEHGEQTIVAPIQLYPYRNKDDRGEYLARIGAEVIITANDENNEKYVLFVPKAKSTTFMELPGGGFNGSEEHYPPTNQVDFEKLILDRLDFKCNLDLNKVIDLHDTGRALVLHEKGVAKTAEVTWNWSYYRLYSAHYNVVLTDADLDYSHNNKDKADVKAKLSGKHINSYNAFCRWIPVKNILANRSITDRYANVIELIKSN